MVEDQPGAEFRPSAPHWMRTEVPDGYTAAHDLLPNETRIFGTESLYGNWRGAMLALAQDFAHVGCIQERIEAGHPRPFSHDPCNKTNVRLSHLLKECGLTAEVLYGSALGGALKETDGMGDRLPNRANARRYGERIVAFTIDAMPNLQAISCLGAFAWECVWGAFELGTLKQARTDRRALLRSRKPHVAPFNGRQIGLFALVHTSTRGVNSHPLKTKESGSAWAAVRADWQAMADWIRAG